MKSSSVCSFNLIPTYSIESPKKIVHISYKLYTEIGIINSKSMTNKNKI